MAGVMNGAPSVTLFANGGYQPSGYFGTGKVAFFFASGTFTVPAETVRVRLRSAYQIPPG